MNSRLYALFLCCLLLGWTTACVTREEKTLPEQANLARALQLAPVTPNRTSIDESRIDTPTTVNTSIVTPTPTIGLNATAIVEAFAPPLSYEDEVAEYLVDAFTVSLHSTGLGIYWGELSAVAQGITWAPTGKQIAYSWFPHQEGADNPNGIYVANVDGSGEPQLACLSSARDHEPELLYVPEWPLVWTGSETYIATTIYTDGPTNHSFGTPQVALCNIETREWELPLSSASSSSLIDWHDNVALVRVDGELYTTTIDFFDLHPLAVEFSNSYLDSLKFYGSDSTFIDHSRLESNLLNFYDISSSTRFSTKDMNLELLIDSGPYTVSPNGAYITWFARTITESERYAGPVGDYDRYLMIYQASDESITPIQLVSDDIDLAEEGVLFRPPVWSPDSSRFVIRVSETIYISDPVDTWIR